MTCREVLDFLADYLDGSLPETEAEPFECHLAQCPACVAYLESYRQTVRLEREALTDDGAAGERTMPEELVQAILAARQR